MKKIANQRRDFLHKKAHYLADRYDAIGIEEHQRQGDGKTQEMRRIQLWQVRSRQRLAYVHEYAVIQAGMAGKAASQDRQVVSQQLDVPCLRL